MDLHTSLTWCRNLCFAVITIGIAVVLISIPVSTAQPPQAQPRLDLSSDPNWALLEFENGSQWYMKMSSIVAIHGIPPASWEKLEYKTKIYGTGFTVNVPYTIEEVEGRMIKARASSLIQRLRDLEREQDEK